MDSNLRSPVRATSISEPPVRHNLRASTRGTEGSNPPPSRGESANPRSLPKSVPGYKVARGFVIQNKYTDAPVRVPRCDREPRQRHALIEAELRVPAPRDRQPSVVARQGIRRGRQLLCRRRKSETMALVVPESEEWRLKLCCQGRARGRP